MAVKTTQKGDLKQKLTDAIGHLKKRHLKVGFLEGSTYPDGTRTAMVAAIQDFGAPNAGIPPRPFFRNAIASNKSGWAGTLRRALVSNKLDSNKALHVLGQVIVAQIQESISEGSYAPLAPATITAKGFDTPLIHTGHMLSSVNYEIIEGD